jgi:hypothetical protein
MPRKRGGSTGAPAHGRRRFKPRELTLGDGSRLVLDAAGSIARISQEGTTTQTWGPDDPEWSRHAIRFGMHAPVATANPHGREVRQERRPRP